MMIKSLLKSKFFKQYGFILGLLNGYIVMNLMMCQERKLYNLELECAQVVKVINKSEYKGLPSILVKQNNSFFEIIQYYSYDYDFKSFKIGDKISKEEHNFNFVRIKSFSLLDTIERNAEGLGPYFFLMFPHDFNLAKVKYDCNN